MIPTGAEIRSLKRSYWVRRIAVVVLIESSLATLLFGIRTYRSFLLLRSAYEVGMPSTSDIRPWMTLRYLATHYRVSVPSLVERLGVPPETDADTSLRSLAERSSLSLFDFVKRTQLAVADIAPPEAAQQQSEERGWLTRLSDDLLSALLIYGYPIMALIDLQEAAHCSAGDGEARFGGGREGC